MTDICMLAVIRNGWQQLGMAGDPELCGEASRFSFLIEDLMSWIDNC